MSSTKFDDHLFANNPFRDNLKKLLGEREKTGARDESTQKAGADASRKKAQKRAKAEDPEYSAECSLFLSAMDGMRNVDKSRAGRPREEMRFSLEDVENFPGKGRGRDEGTGLARGDAGHDARLSRAFRPAASGSLPGRGSGKGRSTTVVPSSPMRSPEKTGNQPVSRTADTGRQESVVEDGPMSWLSSGGESPETPEASDEFLLAMEGVKPLQKAGRDVAPAAPASAMKHVAANVLQDIIDGKVEFELTFTDEYIEGYVVGVDPLLIGKLRQGGYSPEASLDLHGLNSQQAFGALRDFIKAAWYRGNRCLVVVPGRGKNSPNGHGILREKLKLWFTQDPFKRVILAFCTARSHDGGPGAVYVLLRKFKKKGRVAWERVPADEDLL